MSYKSSFWNLSRAGSSICDINNGKQYDYFFLSKGVEDRAYKTIDYLKGFIPQKIIIFDSRRKQELLSAADFKKYNQIEQIFTEEKIEQYQVISAEDYNLGVVTAEKKLHGLNRVAIDISSMNFWEMGDLLYYLIRIAKVDILDLYYTEPDFYKYEHNNIMIYEHPAPTVSFNYPPNYACTRTTQSQEIFIAVMGFQKHILKCMRDNADYSDYYSINGFPAFYPKAKDISQANNVDYLSEVDPVHCYSAQANNPFLCYNTIVDITKPNNDAIFTLCPLGSKPMTVGVLLFVLKHPQHSRVVYPNKECAITKNDGIGNTFCYRITSDFLQ